MPNIAAQVALDMPVVIASLTEAAAEEITQVAQKIHTPVHLATPDASSRLDSLFGNKEELGACNFYPRWGVSLIVR